jgi:hypothetical protein
MEYNPSETPDDSKVERELYRIGEAIRLPQLIVYHSAPEKPVDGLLVICDGVNWNPLGDGIKRPLWYDFTAAVWKKFS